VIAEIGAKIAGWKRGNGTGEVKADLTKPPCFEYLPELVPVELEPTRGSLKDCRAAYFTVLSFNVLADGCADIKQFPYILQKEYLSFEYRSHQVGKMLAALQADIICLQEVDHYADFYKEHLAGLGYATTFREDGGFWSNLIGYKCKAFSEALAFSSS